MRNDEGVTTVRAGASAGRFWSIELSLDTPDDTTAARENIDLHLGKPASGPGGQNIQKTIEIPLFMLPKQETFTYDPDGNLLADGQWTYVYDAENRLVSMQTKDALLPVLNPKPGGERPLKITYTYDYLNRRAGKKVQEMVAGIWQDRQHHLYVYNGSALIAEIDAATRQVLRTFAWGATGELLMIHDRTASIASSPLPPLGEGQGEGLPEAITYLPVHNATGSVTAMVRAANSTTVATYEYDPNGTLLRARGDYAKKNPFTHGGGWMDWETGLTNAGSVYYSPRLGRMINSAPSISGDGLIASFGVAPTISYLPLPSYAIPSGRRSAIMASWQSVDPAELAAYEAAWAAYAREWAAIEPAWAAYEKWLYDITEYMSQFVHGEPYDPPPDESDGYSGMGFASSSNSYFDYGFYVDGFDMGFINTHDAFGIYANYMDDLYHANKQAEWESKAAALERNAVAILNRMEQTVAAFKAEINATIAGLGRVFKMPSVSNPIWQRWLQNRDRFPRAFHNEWPRAGIF